MKTKDIKWCPQHGYPLPCHKCGMPLLEVDQREIFKAGLKEMIEKIQRYIDENNIYQVEFEHYDSNGQWVVLETKRINLLEIFNGQ